MGISTFKYHDKDYDGIVLMIPKGIIVTNPELTEAIEAFEKALNDCKCSTMMPDHQRNLSELENWKDKVKDIEEDEAESKRYMDKRREEDRRRTSGEVLEIVFKEYEAPAMREVTSITLNGEVFGYHDIFRNRGGLTTKVVKAFNLEISKCKNGEEFIEFLKRIDILTPDNSSFKDIRFGGARMTATGGWGDAIYVKFDVAYIKVFKKQTKSSQKNLYYRTHRLIYNKEHGYLLNANVTHAESKKLTLEGGTSTYAILDEAFQRVGNKFIKK